MSSVRSIHTPQEARFIRVSVTAGARREQLFEKSGRLVVSVKEKAERGAANERVRALVARRFGVPTKKVRIISGMRSPNKMIALHAG